MNCGGLHFPDKNGVVAGGMRRDEIAGQMEERSFQDGNATGRPTIANQEALLGLRALLILGKIFGDGFLTVFQDTDTETFFLVEQRKHSGSLVDADKDQHGSERDGSKGVRGHAVDQTGLALDGDHGYAGGELTEGFAKFQGGR